MSGRTEREVKIRFTGESAVLKGSAGEVRKVFQMLTSDLNDARGAGEKLAAAQEQVANSMRRDMAAISEAADVVRDSLGPDMVRAIEASGRTVEDHVQDWRKLGLSLDDITRDSDELARGLRQLDDAARQSSGNVGDGLKKIEEGSNRARGAMGGFVGGALTELPALQGAFGPLAQGLDEMTSGLVEGDIKAKQLIGTFALMALATVIIQGITDDTHELAEAQRKAMRADLVKSWADALVNAADPVQELTDKIAGTGRIIGVMNGMLSSMDLTSMFVQAGLGVKDWTEALANGSEGAEELRAKLAASTLSAEQQQWIMIALTNTQELYADSAERAAETTAVTADANARLTGDIEANTDAMKAQIDAALEDVTSQESLADAYAEAEEAQRDLTSAQLASIDSQYAAADAQDRFIEAMEALAVAVDDPTTGVNELDQAQRTATQAALDMALANQANAEALAIAAGAPLSVDASNRVLIDSLSLLALSLDENSPVRAAILAHIDTLGGVPATVATRVTADIEQASEDIASVAEAAAELNTETDTKANADTATALDLVQTLTLAIEGIPKTIGIDVNLSGVTSVLNSLAELRNALQATADLSDEALLSVDAGIRRVKQGTR